MENGDEGGRKRSTGKRGFVILKAVSTQRLLSRENSININIHRRARIEVCLAKGQTALMNQINVFNLIRHVRNDYAFF